MSSVRIYAPERREAHPVQVRHHNRVAGRRQRVHRRLRQRVRERAGLGVAHNHEESRLYAAVHVHKSLARKPQAQKLYEEISVAFATKTIQVVRNLPKQQTIRARLVLIFGSSFQLR